MVRNDDFFLERWIAWYGKWFGRENLYVFFDGLDQTVPDFCDGVNVEAVPHIEGNVRQGDKGRIAFLNARAAELFDSYDMIVGTDVDEFLMPDPLTGLNLPEFLARVDTDCVSISGLGVDVGQNLREECALDVSAPFLSQRRYARLSTRYSKASVLRRPAEWGCGFHRVKKHNFHIVKDLYLFHFGSVDLERIKAKMNDGEKIQNGWSRHLKKRAETIWLASHAKALGWDKAVRFARSVQNLVRPPYAWNKPSMFEMKILVKIPERFAGIL